MNSWSDEKWAAWRADVERQLADYELAVQEADAWFREWKHRNSGFRCRRRGNGAS